MFFLISSTKNLNLRENDLQDLPRSMKSLSRLEQLDVSFNELQEMSEDVLSSSLKVLFVIGNFLEYFPSSLSTCCPSLEELSLKDNCLEEDVVVYLTSKWTLQLKKLRRLSISPQKQGQSKGNETH